MTSLNSTLKVKQKKIRVGRGIGSGKGKTSGRGVKGQRFVIVKFRQNRWVRPKVKIKSN